MQRQLPVLCQLPTSHEDHKVYQIFCVEYLWVYQEYYRTRQFIGEELILAIGDFSENSPILNPPTLILCHKDTPTKLHAYAILLRTRGWNGRGMEWLLIVKFKIVRIPPI